MLITHSVACVHRLQTKKNKGRFKTKVISSVHPASSTAAADAVPASAPTSSPPEEMDVDLTAVPSPASSLEPSPPPVVLSRPFHVPTFFHPPLGASGLPSLTAVVLPSARPSSLPVNGRVNRLVQTRPHAHLSRAHALRQSFAEKQRRRESVALVKAKAKEVAAESLRLRLEEKRKREQRGKVKAENEKKNRVVQVIKNTAKIKRMSRAQLKQIEKA